MRYTRQSVKLSVFVCGVSIFALAASLTHAQATEGETRFEISPQPLGNALDEFSRQANLDVIMRAETVEGKSASPIRGSMTIEEALEGMLRGTGLNYELGDRSIIIIRSGSSEIERNSLNARQFASNSEHAVQIGQSEQPAQRGSETSTEGEPSLLEEIVVTAQKREQTLQEVPVSVEVLDGEQLAFNQVYTLEEVAKFNPSLTFRSDIAGVNTAFALRGVGGFAAQGGIEPAIGVVIDGVSLARGAEFFTANVEDVQRVEILKGPQGTLFGASNAGGVVNIVTRTPTSEFEASVEGSATTDEEFSGRVVLSGPITDTIRARISSFIRSREGHIENIFADSGDLSRLGEQKSVGVRARIEFDLGSDALFTIGGNFNHLDRSNARQPQRVEDGPVGDARRIALGLGNPALGQRVLDDPFLQSQNGLNEERFNRYRVSGTFRWDITDGHLEER